MASDRDIRFVFTVAGADKVVGAYRSVEKAMQRMGNASQKAAAAMGGKKGVAAGAPGMRLTDYDKMVKQNRAKKLAEANQMFAYQRREDARSVRQLHQVKQRLAKERYRERKRQQREELRHVAKLSRDRARSSRRIGRAAGYVGRGMFAVAGGAALGVGARYGGQAVRESIELDDLARRIAIKGSGYGDRLDPTKLRKGFESTARRMKGVKATEAAAGVDAFIVRSGNIGMAKQSQDTIAKIALASGSSAADIGRTSADLFEKFDIKSIEDLNKALSILTVQGKKGAFEIEDVAKQFPRMAAAAQSFRFDKGIKGVSRLGAFAQIAMKGTGRAPMAATAVENMLTQMFKKSDKIKETFGTDIFTDDTHQETRDIKDILVDMVAGTKGELGMFEKEFTVRSARAVKELTRVYKEQIDAGKSEAAAKDAVAKHWDSFESTIGAVEQVNKDFVDAQKMTSSVLTSVWEDFKGAIGEELTESVAQLAKKFAKLITSTNAIEQVVKLFTALAGSMETLIDMLTMAGIVDEKTPQEQAKIASDLAKEKTLAIFGGDEDKLEAAKEIRRAEASGADGHKINSMLRAAEISRTQYGKFGAAQDKSDIADQFMEALGPEKDESTYSKVLRRTPFGGIMPGTDAGLLERLASLTPLGILTGAANTLSEDAPTSLPGGGNAEYGPENRVNPADALDGPVKKTNAALAALTSAVNGAALQISAANIGAEATVVPE